MPKLRLPRHRHRAVARAARGDRRLRLARAAHADAAADLAPRAARPGGDGRRGRARRLPRRSRCSTRSTSGRCCRRAAAQRPTRRRRTRRARCRVLDTLLRGPRRGAREDLLGAARHAPVLEGDRCWSTASRCATFRASQFGGAHLQDPARDWVPDVRPHVAVRRRWPALRRRAARRAPRSLRCARRTRGGFAASLRGIWQRTHRGALAADAR